MSRRTKGFSLLELVVVLAIFALVALVGVQVIRSTVLAEQRLSAVSENSEQLAIALALLRRDMSAGIALPFHAQGAEPALSIRQTGFSLSVSGLAGIGAVNPGLGRVTWRLAPDGLLTRQVWTGLNPGGPQASGPEVPILSDITGIEIASFSFPAGWQPGFRADPRTPNALPRALRIRLIHRRYAQLETLVTLR